MRHGALVAEMTSRGYRHNNPLDRGLATGNSVQDKFVDRPEKQIEILRGKGCSCCMNVSGGT